MKTEVIHSLFSLIKNVKYLKGMKNKTIATIDSIENPFDDYYVIKLNTAPGLTWLPGEHAMFKLPDKKIDGANYRIFSIASIPEEGFMLLGIRTGREISSYKKELIAMKKGEKLAITGPYGWFLIRDKTSPIILHASGVGITPIRALLKEVENDTSRPIEVIYSSLNYYLFDEEVAEIAKKNPEITLHKTVDVEDTQQKLVELAAKYGDNAYYYISGSPIVIKSVKKLLKGKGIKGKRIIDDTLMGY